MLIFKMTIMLLTQIISVLNSLITFNQYQSSDMEIIIQIKIINQIHWLTEHLLAIEIIYSLQEFNICQLINEH